MYYLAAFKIVAVLALSNLKNIRCSKFDAASQKFEKR